MENGKPVVFHVYVNQLDARKHNCYPIRDGGISHN